jgi:hypothetical protein
MVVSTISMAVADDDRNQRHRVRTHLSGFHEVHFIVGDPTVTLTVPSRFIALSLRRQVRGRDRRTRRHNSLQAELQEPGDVVREERPRALPASYPPSE